MLTSQKNTWPAVGIIFCLVVLAITWASIILQRHVSSKSLVNELQNMRRWHKNVHTALTRSDYRELALRPVLDAVRLYKKTAKFTNKGMIYASIIFLASFVVIPLFHSAEKPLATSIERDQTPPAGAASTKATPTLEDVIQKPEVLSEDASISTQTARTENDNKTESAGLLEDEQPGSSE